MRSTIIKGLTDGLYINLGCSTDIVGAVMEAGKAVDYLVFELELTGAELLQFLGKFNLQDKFKDEIKSDNQYKLTAYDW
jgi:hypothetical protein